MDQSTPLDATADFRLDGRVALVTGGSRGIGRAAVERLAAAGADVVVVSRKADACRAVAEEVAARYGHRALGLGCHVGRWAEIDALVEQVYAEFGHIDVLVNNAGISPLYESLDAVTEELWHKVVDVNLTGPFRLTALVGTRMAAGDGGSIINISSVAGELPTAATVPYSAAKAALNAMTIGTARALGPKVRVNAILPGTFLTDIASDWDMDVFNQHARHFALQRGAPPEEITGTILYLASDASSYTTGATLRVDGGFIPTTAVY